MKTIAELFSNDVFDIIGNDQLIPNEIKIDSRDVKENDLFFAIKGFESDGHLYIDNAIANGASAVCCDNLPSKLNTNITYIAVQNTRFVLPKISASLYNHPEDKIIKIAVTGTNGKTSSAYFIQTMLKNLGEKCGLIGTIGYDDGNETYPSSHTTPESFILFKLLHKMVQNKCRYVVMEVSSHALILNRVSGILFDRAIFTNFSQDHLDFHSTMEEYFKAKSLLFSKHLNGAAILNYDDEKIRTIQTVFKYTFGYHEKSDLKIIKYHCSLKGTEFSFSYEDKEYFINTNVLGKYNISNIIGSISLLFSLGFEFKSLVNAAKNLKPVPGRMEKYSIGKKVAIVDYAHTNDALENLLKTCRELIPNGKIICVFGCGGDRDKSKRPLMAKAAENYANTVVLTSDNPRTEDPDQIINDAYVGFTNKENIIKMTDRKAAILKAIEFANDGDLIVVAGKGHENYQEINKERLFFSDSEIIINEGGILD